MRRRFRKKGQSAFVAVLMALTLVVGQIPVSAFAEAAKDADGDKTAQVNGGTAEKAAAEDTKAADTAAKQDAEPAAKADEPASKAEESAAKVEEPVVKSKEVKAEEPAKKSSDDADKGGAKAPAGAKGNVTDFKPIYTNCTPAAGGIITTDPEGEADPGDIVFVTVTENPGYTFDDISIVNSDGDPIMPIATDMGWSFSMPDSLVRISATFTQETTDTYFSVMTATEGSNDKGGTYTINNGDEKETATNQIVPSGTEITLKAKAKDGYDFKGWYEGNRDAQAGDPLYFDDRLITENETYTFTSTATGGSDVPYICCVFEKQAEERTAVEFQVWAGLLGGQDNINASGGKVAVSYDPGTPNPLDIEAKDGTSFSYGEIAGCYEGDSVTVIAEPEDGYQFAGWYEADGEWPQHDGKRYQGDVLSTDTTYTFKPTNQNRLICGVFEEASATEPIISNMSIEVDAPSGILDVDSASDMVTVSGTGIASSTAQWKNFVGTSSLEPDYLEFTAGKTYYACITVNAQDGYTFAKGDPLSWSYYGCDYNYGGSAEVDGGTYYSGYVSSTSEPEKAVIWIKVKAVEAADGEYSSYFAVGIADDKKNENVGGGITIEGDVTPDIDGVRYSFTETTAKRGTEVTLTAQSLDGYVFSGWYSSSKYYDSDPIYDDNCLSTSTTYTFTDNPAGEGEIPRVYAVFEPATVSVFAMIDSSSGNGRIKAQYTNSYDESATMTEASVVFSAKYKTDVSLTAIAAAGYNFKGWYTYDLRTSAPGDLVSASAAYAFAAAEKTVLIAIFEEQETAEFGTTCASGGTYDVSVVEADGSESTETGLDSSKVYTMETGAQVTLTAHPADDYLFLGWYKADKSGSAYTAYTDELITEDVTYTFTLSSLTENTGYYAKFTPDNQRYIVRYYYYPHPYSSSGSNIVLATSETVYGSKALASGTVDASVEGLTFTGKWRTWLTSYNDDNIWDFSQPVSTHAFIRNGTGYLDLYADYEPWTSHYAVYDSTTGVVGQGGKIYYAGSYWSDDDPEEMWTDETWEIGTMRAEGGYRPCYAVADEGYEFDYWLRVPAGSTPGAASGNEVLPSTTYWGFENATGQYQPATDGETLYAVFKKKDAAPVELTVSTDSNKGVLYINDSDYAASFEGTYYEGSQVKLEAKPKYTDLEFDHWTVKVGDADAIEITDNPYNITLEEDTEVTAVFRNVPGLNVGYVGEGSISGTIELPNFTNNVSDPGYYTGATGSAVSLSATPAEGYVFKGWYEGVPGGASGFIVDYTGEPLSTDSTYNFTMTKDGAEICAVFEKPLLIIGVQETATGGDTAGVSALLSSMTVNGESVSLVEDPEISGGFLCATPVPAGGAISVVVTPTDSGMVSSISDPEPAIAGWASAQSANADGGYTIEFTMLEEDANFTVSLVQAVTVSFNTHGGTPATIDSQKIVKGGKATSPGSPKKTPLTFMGWYDNAEYSGDVVNLARATFDADTTLHAKWVGNVVINPVALSDDADPAVGRGGTVNINGGPTGAGPVSAQPLDGSQVTLNAIAAEGYVFSGWRCGSKFTEGEFISTEASYTFTVSTDTMTGNPLYWAIFNEAPVTIHFDANGGSGDMADAGAKVGDAYKLPACDFDPPSDSQAFKAWEIDGEEYGVDDEYTIPAGVETVTVKALWKDIVNVIGEISGGDENALSSFTANGTSLSEELVFDAPLDELEIEAAPADGYMIKLMSLYTVGNPIPKALVRPAADGTATISSTNVAAGSYKVVVTVAETVTVTFDANATGASAPAAQVIEKGGKATRPDDPERTSSPFHFLHWCDTPDCAGDYVNFTTRTFDADTTLYAAWGKSVGGKVYNKTTQEMGIGGTVKVNNDEFSTDSGVIALENSTVTVQAKADNGYVFVGWVKGTDPTGEIVSNENPYTVENYDGSFNNMIAVFAEAVTITFDPGEGQSTPLHYMNAVEVEKGSTYYLPDCDFLPPLLHVTDKTFDTWQVGDDTSNTKIPGESITVSDDITITALWKDAVKIGIMVGAEDGTLKTLKFNGDEISSTEGSTFNVILEPGVTINIVATPEDGYLAFMGTIDSTPQIDDIDYDRSTGATDFTMYNTPAGTYFFAVNTQAAVTVTFDGQGGSPVPLDQVIAVGEKANKPSDEEKPTKEHFTFAHWYAGDDPESKFNFNTAIEQDTTLKAAWAGYIIVEAQNLADPEDNERAGLVYFDNDYGEWPVAGGVELEGTNHVLKAEAADGYRFVGWAKQTDNGLEIVDTELEYALTFDAAAESTFGFESMEGFPADFLSIYALFAKVVTVSFDLNGGTIDGDTTVDDQVIDEGSWADDPGNPTKENLSFDGWYATDSDTAVDFDTDTFDEDTVLTAKYYGKFEANTYDKTQKLTSTGGKLYVNDDTTGVALYSNDKVAEGSAITVKAEANDGFRFIGWTLDSPSGDIVSTDDTYTVDSFAGNTKVYAVFVETTTVTFKANGGTTGSNWWNPATVVVDKGTNLSDLMGETAEEPSADVITAPTGTTFKSYTVTVEAGIVEYEPGSAIDFEITEPTSVSYQWRNPIVTIHWSSIDGVDLMSAIQTDPVPVGSTVQEALATIGKSRESTFFTKDGYETWDSLVYKPITEYAGEDNPITALMKGRVKADATVEGDMDIYSPMAKLITGNVPVSIEAPECGVETTTEKDGNMWDWSSQTNPPVVTVSDGVNYAVDMEGGANPYWCVDVETVDPFIGTFEGEQDYFADFWLVSDFGYVFADDVAIELSGGEMLDFYYDLEYIGGTAKVKAVHIPGDAAVENEKAATCTEDGGYDEVVRCTACEEVLETEHFTTDKLGHDWGEWTTVKEPTETEEGLEKRECSRCDAEETRAIDKLEYYYYIASGDGSVWTKGSGEALGFAFKRSLADETTFDHFKTLFIDGKEVPSDAYVASPGSVAIGLAASYLEGLEVGEHTITAAFDDDKTADGTFTVKAAPSDNTGDEGTDETTADNGKKATEYSEDTIVKAGDNMAVGVVIAIVAAAVAAIVGIFAWRRSRR